MNVKLKFVFLLTMVLHSLSTAKAQSYIPNKIDDSSIDNSIRQGKLPNGFTYYIKSLEEPQAKTYLRFYVKAGYECEDGDQLHLSHFLEHMAFKGSEHFPLGIANETKLLKEIGMDAIGRDFYANAGDKSVNYVFNANPANKKSLETGLLWFRDIATGLKLDGKDIDSERGALKQEIIIRAEPNLNEVFAKSALYAKLFPCKRDESNYFEHMATFPPEALRRFYMDWYRPDLMAVCVIGNIENVVGLEELIREVFVDIRPSNNPRKSPNCDSLYLNSPPQFAVVGLEPDSIDAETKEKTEFQLFYRDRPDGSSTTKFEETTKKLLWKSIVGIMNSRFEDLNNNYNNGLRALAWDPKEYKSVPSTCMVNIITENGKEREAISSTMEIVGQFQKFGATSLEWEREKARQLKKLSVEPPYLANYWIKEIWDHYTLQEPLPSNKLSSAEQWLSKLSLDDFNDQAAKLFYGMPQDIGIIAPMGNKMLSCPEEDVRSWINKAIKTPKGPYIPPAIPSKLINNNKIAELREKGYTFKGKTESGASEFILDNGVRVVLLPNAPSSDVKEDKVKLHGFSAVGASCLPEEEYYSAISAPRIVLNAGVGKFDKFEINRFLADKGVQGVAPYVKAQESGIRGETIVDGLESLLQMVYLYYTRTRKDKDANLDWMKMVNSSYSDPTYNLAYTDFNNYIQEFIAGWPTALVDGTHYFNGTRNTNFKKAYKNYQELFGNARDFTFLISGSFDQDKILPLLQKYLGNLPNTSEPKLCNFKSSAQDHLPKGPIVKKFPIPTEYSRNNILYSMMFIKARGANVNWRKQIKTELLGAFVWELAWALRFEKGYSIYHIEGYGQYNKEMSRYEVGIKVDCEPEEWKKVQKECRQIFSDIKKGNVQEELFDRVYKRLSAKYDANKSGNPEQRWSKTFEHYRYNMPWTDPQDMETYMKSISFTDIVEFSLAFFDELDQYEFIMGEDL